MRQHSKFKGNPAKIAMANRHPVFHTHHLPDIGLQASRRDWIMIALTVLAASLLNITPVNASVGPLLLLILCTASLSNKFSAFVALSASQTVADPVTFPLTLMQCLFIFWPLHLMRCREHVDSSIMKTILLWTVPASLYFKLISLLKWGSFSWISYFDLASLAGVMAGWYAARIQGRWLLGLLCLGLGALPSLITFWAHIAGVSTEGVVMAKGGAVAGIGIGRSDGNMTSISIALSATICLALLSSEAAFQQYARSGGRQIIAQAVLITASLPAVIATMSRGGVIHYIAGLGTILVFSRKSFGKALGAAVIVAMTMFFLNMTNAINLLKYYGESMAKLTEEQMADSLLASRSTVYEGALSEIMASPLIGTNPTTRQTIGGYGYDYASHNVWMDFGREAGILAMIWFTYFFFYPISLLIKRKGLHYAMPFIAALAVFFSVFMALSQGNHKTFYALWALTMGAALPSALPHRFNVNKARQPKKLAPVLDA